MKSSTASRLGDPQPAFFDGISNPFWNDYPAVERDLARVAQVVRDSVQSASPRLRDALSELVSRRGKMLRPAFVVLAARLRRSGSRGLFRSGGRAFGPTRELPDKIYRMAAAVEILHLATLVHDDIMDHAPERRGRPTVHLVWDESTAILAGDLLMGMAYDLLARTPTDRLAEMVRVFHRMVQRLCEGQALDEQFEAEDDVTVERYLDMIDRKTGALLEAVLVLGGLVGGADDEARGHLAEAGHAFGRAFQIQDDLLDLTAADDGWGKTIGGDLMEGKKTFLLLRALERADGDDRAWFRRIVTDGGLDAGEIGEARRRMDALGVLGEARREVLRHYDIGERALRHLPEGSGRDGLLWIAGRMAQRVR